MKEVKTNISVIIPVHELNDDTKKLFEKSIKSVEAQRVMPDELVIVTPKGSETCEYIKKIDFGPIEQIVKIVENDGNTDFATQANLGVKESKSDWVSFLEYDDEFSNIWIKNVVEYRKAYDNVGMFMPIIIDVDKDDKFMGFTNEAVWANSFSDELGILDLNALLNYQNFNIDGIVVKKSLFEEYGGFKASMKLTFIYEFLLRMTFKDVRVMCIPKFGYRHMNLRPDSLFMKYRETIDPVEAKWWLNQAKKEYYFEKDRNITYDKQVV